jgi:hypothetical protein
MKLEDIIIDYIAVFPDGDLNYLKYFIKQKSNSDLINFITILDNDFQHNKGFYDSFYMQKFLMIIKNEYVERIKFIQLPTTTEISNKQLSCNAEEFIPLSAKNS